MEFIRGSIDSVLNQVFKDYEFIIIDDCSSDESVDIIKSYSDKRIRLILNEKNIGLTSSLNKGLELAKGEYIARIDVDDICLPRRLERQVEFLDHHKEICIVGTRWNSIDENNRVLSTIRLPIEPYECGFWLYAYGEQPVGHPCVMFRKKKIKNLGGYSENYKVAQDADLWFRAAAKGFQFANIPISLMLYRIHQNQISTYSGKTQNTLHDKALSKFISNQINKKVTPEVAALLRPVNFNDKYFNDENKTEKMFRLKKQILNEYFKHSQLSAFQTLKCCGRLWASLYPLCNLKLTNYQKMIFKNTKFCYHIMQNQLTQKKTIFLPYLIMFFILLHKIILIKMFQKILRDFKRVIYKKYFGSLKTSY